MAAIRKLKNKHFLADVSQYSQTTPKAGGRPKRRSDKIEGSLPAQV